jgi:hypothetical protein
MFFSFPCFGTLSPEPRAHAKVTGRQGKILPFVSRTLCPTLLYWSAKFRAPQVWKIDFLGYLARIYATKYMLDVRRRVAHVRFHYQARSDSFVFKLPETFLYIRIHQWDGQRRILLIFRRSHQAVWVLLDFQHYIELKNRRGIYYQSLTIDNVTLQSLLQ